MITASETRHHALLLCWVMPRRMVDRGCRCCDCGAALVAVFSCTERHCKVMFVGLTSGFRRSRIQSRWILEVDVKFTAHA